MEEISVKLYEVDGGTVRRFPFQVPKAASGSYQGVYSSLFEKVKQFYPTDGSLQLFWKDEEGDLIIMNTDDEAKEALRHRKGDILRIFARSNTGSDFPKMETVVTQKEPINVFIGDDLIAMEETPREEKREEQQQPDTGKTHTGIVCDGCDGGIEGIRYKCLICRDYDLCSTCEGKRIHDQHPMIRFTQPGDRSWLPAFMASQGMNHFPFPGGKHGRCPFYGGRHGQGAGRCHRAAGGGSEQQPQEQEKQQQGPQEIPGAHFLRDVGQAVAAVLSGFGIDVDVDVDHDGQRTNVASAKSEKKEQETEEKKQDTATGGSMDQPMEQVASPPTVVTLESGPNTPEGQQDWMILENPDIATSQQAAATATASYPVLDPIPATPLMDPRIAAALTYMLSMGFTNEGGWLTQLLEAKQGDIAAVLEILHPSNKP